MEKVNRKLKCHCCLDIYITPANYVKELDLLFCSFCQSEIEKLISGIEQLAKKRLYFGKAKTALTTYESLVAINLYIKAQKNGLRY
jgi:hypothetical protein